MTKILGIVNLTPDSFFDGGKYLNPDVAIEHARQLIENGASIIDLGAESTHPDSQRMTAAEEIVLLDPVIKALKNEGVSISVDTYKPEVMEHVLGLGVDMINDVTGMPDPSTAKLIKDFGARVVIMYSRSDQAHAKREAGAYQDIMEELKIFFGKKIADLLNAGLSEEQIILDPGMGFFLGMNPEPSLMVLKHLRELKGFGCKTLVSTSNKSFIGTVTGRDIQERSYGTLATELWAAMQDVDYIRTHNVAGLSDGLAMLDAIQKVQ